MNSDPSPPLAVEPTELTPFPADAGRAPNINLRARAQSAVIWNTGFNLFRDLLQFVVMLVLVRLLDASAYGQFSLVTSIIGFISIFAFNNFVAYTLQVHRDEDVHYQDHFTAGAAIQAALFLLTNVVAMILRGIPTYASVAPLVHVMSLTFLISFPSDFRIKMLERELDWRRLRLLHAGGLILMSGTAIAMAAFGAGSYALLVPGMLVAIPFIADLFLKMRWRPVWTWSWEHYRTAWVFGTSRIGSGLAINGRQLLESGVLASVLGFATLGFVNRALGLAQLFCVKFSFQLLYALYPMLARYEPGSAAFQRVTGLVLRCVAWIAIPIGALLSALAPIAVKTVYGDRWTPVIGLLSWAMAIGVAGALAYASYTIALANNKAAVCLSLDVAACLGAIINLFLILPFGLRYYLGATACLQILLFISATSILLRIGSVKWSGIGGACLPPLLAVGIALFICEMLASIVGVHKTTIPSGVCYAVLFLLVYILVLRLGFARQLGELLNYFPGSNRIKGLVGLK
jgi:O-antigen/teichoic acid export membrane protein